MSQRPLGAQISHMLKSRGVDTIFGIPGVHNVEMYRGIEEAGIRHVLARHEQGAGFMADGYARAAHRPGICGAQAIGAANLAAAHQRPPQCPLQRSEQAIGLPMRIAGV